MDKGSKVGADETDQTPKSPDHLFSAFWFSECASNVAHGLGRRIPLFTNGLQRVTDRHFGFSDEFVDARNFLCQRPCADQPHRPRNFDCIVGLTRLLVGKTDGGKGRRRDGLSRPNEE